ncbi:hypothetical protein AGRO_5407 [Agrobacterium sp. ATCC 31749]|nr:hypothetical protein AGRO_5407 [Agrobacterium sp. ATCC 31749]
MAKRFSRPVPVFKGYSSVGRAAVSKTAGRKFEPYCPCHFPFASAVFAAWQMGPDFRRISPNVDFLLLKVESVFM